MHIVEPLLKLVIVDRTLPQIAVAKRPGRNDTETSPSPGSQRPWPAIPHHRRINLVLRPVAIDRSSRCLGDDRSHTLGDRAPGEAVDQRIFECEQSVPAADGEVD